MASREHWGPKTWRYFHLLASISDRKDACALWQPFLRTTAQVLPCELCRQHMSQYLVQHRFVVNPAIITGAEVKESMVRYLGTFHNSVNERLGKPIVSYEEIVAFYEPEEATRPSRAVEAAALFGEIVSMYAANDYLRRHPAAFTQWQRQGRFLLSLLASGPLP
jgi:hypothetical protein